MIGHTLYVKYVRTLSRDGEELLRRRHQHLQVFRGAFRDRLLDPATEVVILVGPSMAHGWRVQTARQVRFCWEVPDSEQHEVEMMQAENRIVWAGYR